MGYFTLTCVRIRFEFYLLLRLDSLYTIRHNALYYSLIRASVGLFSPFTVDVDIKSATACDLQIFLLRFRDDRHLYSTADRIKEKYWHTVCRASSNENIDIELISDSVEN